MTPFPRQRLVVALAAAVVGLSTAFATAQGTADLVERRLLDLERQLLTEDLAELELARVAAEEAAGVLGEVVDGLDAANLAGATASRIAALERALVEGAEVQALAARRVEIALAAVGDRLRRVRLLAVGVRAGGEEVVPDTLTGRWEVVVMPDAVSGEMHLDQAGTLVAGSYRFADGSRGSFEGTLVAGLLRLRRIDVVSGFDSLFEAEVDPAAGRLEGRWQATILGRGGAGGGQWSAVRVPSGSAGGAEGVEPATGELPAVDEPPAEEPPIEPEDET